MAPIAPVALSIEPPAEPVPNPIGPVELLWPSVTFASLRSTWTRLDERGFPERTLIDTRRREIKEAERQASDALALDAFLEAMALAQVRIWILDPKFDTSQAMILEAVADTTDAADIRILTESHDEAERRRVLNVVADLSNLANGRSPRPTREISIKWLTVLDKDRYPFLHDRFAIVDVELWHFGATVGGAHHGLNAASRGWDASSTRAIAFFKDLWDGVSRPQTRHARSLATPPRRGRR